MKKTDAALNIATFEKMNRRIIPGKEIVCDYEAEPTTGIVEPRIDLNIFVGKVFRNWLSSIGLFRGRVTI